MSITTIIAATDLSPRSDRAVARAFALAAAHEARVIVATVIDEDLPDPLGQVMRRETEATLAEHLIALPGAGRVQHETRVLSGQPHRALLTLAELERADLIVLGLHRHRGLADLFHGTTVERLVRAADIPVLVAHQPLETRYEHVLGCVDFSAASAAALCFAARLLPQARLSAFHAYFIPFKGFLTEGRSGSALSEKEQAHYAREPAAQMAAFLSGPDMPTVESHIREGAVNTVFGQCLRDLKPDLIALGAHGRPSLSPSYLGSFAEEVLRDPSHDVLVLKPRKFSG